MGRAWANLGTAILGGLLAGALFLFGAIDYANGTTGAKHNPDALNFAVMGTAVVVAAVTSRPVRLWASRYIPIDADNPVHALALALAVIVFGVQAASIAFTDVLAAELQTPPLSIGDLLAQGLPFLVIAFAGVGIWIRRGALQSVARLGLVTPAWWQVALALAAAGAFYAVSLGSDALSHLWTPGVAREVDVTTQHLFGPLTSDYTGLLAIALIPGVCEELLFRGALQPRLGLVITAVLFTAIHAEYGVSLDIPTIFVFALALGLVRKYANTTASVICHASYNLLSGLVPSGPWQEAGLVVEVLLVAAVTYAIWSRRRSAGHIAEPAAQETGVG